MIRLVKNIVVGCALVVSDIISFFTATTIIIKLLSNELTASHRSAIEQWEILHWIVMVCCIGWYATRLRHYNYRKTFWYELREILRTISIFATFELIIVVFCRWPIPWSVWFSIWVTTVMLVVAFRMITKKLLTIIKLWQREAIIVGSGRNAVDAWKAMSGENNLGVKVTLFAGNPSTEKGASTIEGIPIVYQEPQKIIASYDKRTQFVIAVEGEESDIRSQWLRELMHNGNPNVSVIPTLRGMPLDNTDMFFIFSHEVIIFRVNQNLTRLQSRFFKRTFDIFASLFIILLLSPLFIYIRSKVKNDGGPAIYGHERVGKNGKIFKCLKFRSMAVNSKELLSELLEKDSEARSEWEETFKLRNDPRITKIGVLLRRTSMDELPQLFNVLKGDMSLVGPRPIIYEELRRYREHVDYYLMSKPGMTGLWQVSGRSDVDYETRVYFDAWYVKNWSMWNDIAILFKTVAVVLKRDGAY